MKLTHCSVSFISAALATVLCTGIPQASAAPASTTTTLAMTSGGNAVTPGGSVASGSEITLTATVAAGLAAVTVGQVNFCDASATYCTDIHLLGTAQLIQTGAGAGTAVLRLHPGIGDHSYKATFAGTPNGATVYAASTSSTATLTVTGTFPTTTAIAQSGSAGNYSLTATVTGKVNAATLPAPAGTVSFLDTSNSNLSLGSATLGTGAATAVSFLNSSNLEQGRNPLGLAVGDFNGDGIPDLVVATASAETVAIFLGNSDGTFSAAGLVPIAGPDAQQVVVGDFNGDGKADVALLFADINLVQVLLGNGDGTFNVMPAIPVSSPAGYLFTTADFNGDGKADLVLANYLTDTLTMLLGNGDGTFTTAPATPAMNGFPQAVAVGDFNGDGIPDLAVLITPGAEYTPGSVAILLGNGNGTFTQQAESPVTGDNPISIVTGDFRGNGSLDLAVANTYVDTGAPGTVTVLLGNGNGTFTPTAVSPVVGLLPYSIAVGDFNGDGKADLVTSNAGSDTETVLLGKGDGTFAVAASPTVGKTPNVSAVGDFNGDGLSDVAAANNDASSVTVLLAQETWTATATATGISPTGTGIHQVDADYPGNSTFGSSISTTTGLTAVPPPSFAITGTAVTVLPGASNGNTSTITVSPSGAFTGNVVLTAVVTSSPANALDPPTFSFGTTSPASITGAAAGTATLTITTTASTSSSCTASNKTDHGIPWYAGGGAVLACVLFFGIPGRRRGWRTMLGMLALLVVLTSDMLACGSGSPDTSCPGPVTPGTTSGSYTVTVTGTSGATTATGTVALTVQ